MEQTLIASWKGLKEPPYLNQYSLDWSMEQETARTGITSIMSFDDRIDGATGHQNHLDQ